MLELGLGLGLHLGFGTRILGLELGVRLGLLFQNSFEQLA